MTRKWWILLIVLGYILPVRGQKTDSLWAEFNNITFDSTRRITSLHLMAKSFISNDPDSALQLAKLEQSFAEQMEDSSWIASALNLQGGALTMLNDFAAAMDRFHLILDIRLATHDTVGTASAYNNIGNIYYYKGDYSKTIDYYISSLHYEQLGNNRTGIATSYINIGSVYALQKNYRQALDYFNRALNIYEEIIDDSGIASCYANMGNAYKSIDSLPRAMDYYHRALQLMLATKDEYGLAASYLNLAEVYRLQGDFKTAFSYYQKCEDIRKKQDDQFGLGMVWINRGTAYALMSRYAEAQGECEKGLHVAEKYEALKEQHDACECLYLVYKGLKQEDKALAFFERKTKLQDSLARDETMMKLQVMEFRAQVAKDSLIRESEKQALATSHSQALNKGKGLRNILIGGGAVLLMLSIFLYRLFHKTRASKQQSDHVLQNILPADIAEQLKTTGKADAREYDGVTMLFTDFVGFTRTSESMRAQELVDELNQLYSRFDEIVSSYAIEKIKSIGDAYMAAGGLPVHDITAVKNTVLAALDMQDFIIQRKQERIAKGMPGFDMRVGIHTGSVVAGIIGVKKFQYDVWGDTVNTANRMETNGAPGRVNISDTTYAFIKEDPDFIFEERSKIEVKGKGDMQMYFVTRSKSETN